MAKTVEELTQAERDQIMDIIMADKEEDEILADLDSQLDPEIREAASEYIGRLFAGSPSPEEKAAE